MKRTLYFFYFVSFAIVLTSCATAIKTAEYVKPYELSNVLNAKPNIDFIGYKVDSNILSSTSSTKISAGTWHANVDTVMSEYDQAKVINNTESLKKLGYILENHGIALDKSSNYFGIYSLQEMELYRGSNRYVTFVEVAQSKLNYDDNKGSKTIWGGVAGGLVGAGVPFAILGAAYSNNEYASDMGNGLLGVGIGCSAVGLLCAIPALTPTKTKIQFNDTYNVYLYDTQTKQLIRKDAVSVNLNNTFNGSYTYDDASKDIVHDYISRHVSNAILEKYSELSKWLANRS